MNSTGLPGKKLQERPFSFFEAGSLKLFSALILLTVISYYPVLQADFLWYDDDMMIFNNPLINELSFGSVKRLFSFQNIVHYHPFVYISYVLERSFIGLDPFYYHLNNLLLHCANIILVFYLITGIKDNKAIAFITAVLFAVHPLHVESVAWVTERKDLLYSLFYLISLICYIKYKKNHSVNFYVCSLVFFIFSCLSKAMAVTLPFVILLVDFIPLKSTKITIKEKIPFAAVSVLFAVINLNVAYYETDIWVYSIYERISLICHSILFYPFKMLFPFRFSAIYGFPLNPGIEVLASPFIIIILICSLLYLRKKIPPHVKFGLLFYIFTLIPVLPILPFGISAAADRFSYIPLVGLFYIAAHFICGLLRKYQLNKSYVRILTAGIVSVVILLSFLTWSRAQKWQNTEELMNDVMEKDSSNCHAYFILGNYYSDNGRNDKAIDCYIKCIYIVNDYSEAYYNLGNVYFNSGNLEEAMKCYLKAVENNPGDKLAYNNLGVVYEHMGYHEKAIEYYKVSARMGYEPAQHVLRYYGVK